MKKSKNESTNDENKMKHRTENKIKNGSGV